MELYCCKIDDHKERETISEIAIKCETSCRFICVVQAKIRLINMFLGYNSASFYIK